LGILQPFKESGAGIGPGISILPLGCATMEQAVDQFVRGIPDNDLTDLDRQVQERVVVQLKSLVRVCLSSQAPQLLTDLEILMQAQAEKFISTRMRETDVADFFLKQYQEDADIDKDIAGAFHQAGPGLSA